ncbi:hypothetical protein NC651_030350 [Populus alba x Populus x berolinensis]|nr:hypothetical protein NC651_030350 [Populus alba x Populus x berolinensis]
MPSDGQQVSQQSLEIKQNDKFFTRIMSKESSMANSSNRVYYGGASGAVPFMWESRPGLMEGTMTLIMMDMALDHPFQLCVVMLNVKL